MFDYTLQILNRTARKIVLNLWHLFLSEPNQISDDRYTGIPR